MARMARAEVFAADEVVIIHVMNRTVRRCFLLGDDLVTSKNYDHRKQWIGIGRVSERSALGSSRLAGTSGRDGTGCKPARRSLQQQRLLADVDGGLSEPAGLDGSAAESGKTRCQAEAGADAVRATGDLGGRVDSAGTRLRQTVQRGGRPAGTNRIDLHRSRITPHRYRAKRDARELMAAAGGTRKVCHWLYQCFGE